MQQTILYECVQEGVLPKEAVDSWATIAGVWVNWEADDPDLIYAHNYETTSHELERMHWLNR